MITWSFLEDGRLYLFPLLVLEIFPKLAEVKSVEEEANNCSIELLFLLTWVNNFFVLL